MLIFLTEERIEGEKEKEKKKRTDMGEQSLTVNIFCAKTTVVPLRTWKIDCFGRNMLLNGKSVLSCYYFVKLNTLMNLFRLPYYYFQDTNMI